MYEWSALICMLRNFVLAQQSESQQQALWQISDRLQRICDREFGRDHIVVQAGKDGGAKGHGKIGKDAGDDGDVGTVTTPSTLPDVPVGAMGAGVPGRAVKSAKGRPVPKPPPFAPPPVRCKEDPVEQEDEADEADKISVLVFSISPVIKICPSVFHIPCFLLCP